MSDQTADLDFGVPFVYCKAHLGVHSVGWCSIDKDHKIPLLAPTHEEAVAYAYDQGWPIYGRDDRPGTWDVTGTRIVR